MRTCGTLYIEIRTQRFPYLKSWCNSGCAYVCKSCISHYGAYWDHIHPLRQQKVCADIRHTPTLMHLNEKIGAFLGYFFQKNSNNVPLGAHTETTIMPKYS